ncbi:MAG TPA: HupE/UreJ family protein, partial [Steroidobacteraceae bacterium]
MARFFVPLVLLLALAVPPATRAHTQSTSFIAIEMRGDEPVALRWDLSVHDLIWSVFIDADFDGLASQEEIEAARAAIEKAVLAQITISRGDAPCSLRVRGLELADREGQAHLSVALLADCAREGRLTVGGPLFMTGDASQRVLLSAHRGDELLTGVIGAAAPAWIEPGRASAWASFARFIGEGVWHVLIGYDHIAFILLLLLPSVVRPVDGRWQGASGLAPVARDLFTIVTAFTVAHSITLALAVTRTVVLPTQPIEIAIAASIALAGLLNL